MNELVRMIGVLILVSAFPLFIGMNALVGGVHPIFQNNNVVLILAMMEAAGIILGFGFKSGSVILKSDMHSVAYCLFIFILIISLPAFVALSIISGFSLQENHIVMVLFGVMEMGGILGLLSVNFEVKEIPKA